MRWVIVAGSRTFDDYKYLRASLIRLFDGEWSDFGILSDGQESKDHMAGGVFGADALGERFAAELKVRCERFNAQWAGHGISYGPIRNREMVRHAQVFVAFWDGQSRGTRNMIDAALIAGLEVHVYRFATPPRGGEGGRQ